MLALKEKVHGYVVVNGKMMIVMLKLEKLILRISVEGVRLMFTAMLGI
jgi:hypothetical protein